MSAACHTLSTAVRVGDRMLNDGSVTMLASCFPSRLLHRRAAGKTSLSGDHQSRHPMTAAARYLKGAFAGRRSRSPTSATTMTANAIAMTIVG